MSDFINRIKTKDGSVYDVNDSRLPYSTSEDADKIVGVSAEGKYVLKPSVKEQVEGGAEAGTIVDALGLDSDGKLVKGAVSGGTKLYKHELVLEGGGGQQGTMEVISTSATPYDASNYVTLGQHNELRISMNISSVSMVFILGCQEDSNQLGVTFVIHSSGSTTVNYTTFTFVSDTVTEI